MFTQMLLVIDSRVDVCKPSELLVVHWGHWVFDICPLMKARTQSCVVFVSNEGGDAFGELRQAAC